MRYKQINLGNIENFLTEEKALTLHRFIIIGGLSLCQIRFASQDPIVMSNIDSVEFFL